MERHNQLDKSNQFISSFSIYFLFPIFLSIVFMNYRSLPLQSTEKDQNLVHSKTIGIQKAKMCQTQEGVLVKVFLSSEDELNRFPELGQCKTPQPFESKLRVQPPIKPALMKDPRHRGHQISI